MRIGEQVRIARERAGMSVPELAKRTGMSGQFFYNLERGCDIRYATVLRICSALDLSPSALVSITETADEQPVAALSGASLATDL